MGNSFVRLVAIIMLIILSPILIIVSFVSKRQMGSPVLFKQERARRYGLPFYIYKFRTMIYQVDEKGNLLPSYQRVTPLGNFIRKSSLDELDQ